MYDRELAREILSQILTALDTVLDRFSQVESVDDLKSTPHGKEKLDALCMQLRGIEEPR